MSNYHGNLSRLVLCIQEVEEPVAFPGWGSDLNLKRLKKKEGWASAAMGTTATKAPEWMSNVRIPFTTRSREFVHTMGRYPGRNGVAYRYEMDHLVEGRSSTVSWNVEAYSVVRQNYWVQQPGHGRYYINVQYVDGTTWSSGEITLYTNWHGNVVDWWADEWRWRRSARGVVGNKPINVVTLGFIAELRSNSYHDVGDRSPGWSWNTNVAVAGQLTNAGFNAAVIGLGWFQDHRLDRVHIYEQRYGAPTVAPVAGTLPVPRATRISNFAPPSIWSSIQMSGSAAGTLYSPMYDIKRGTDNGQREDFTDGRYKFGWSDVGLLEWMKNEGVFLTTKEHRSNHDGLEKIYINPKWLRGVLQIRSGGNVTDRYSGTLVRTINVNEAQPYPFDVPKNANWIMWIENKRGY